MAHHDSGAWINAFPISALGIRLDDSEVQIAISVRLGLPVRGNAASVMGTLDWMQIDQEFMEQQREKLAAEEVGQQQKKQQHKQGSAELTLTDEKMANIHSLLSEEMEHSSQTQQTQSGSELFSCIDTNKLHGTLETAVALSRVEQGISASMLPVQVVANKKEEPAEKELPSPTGKKGCALFDFEGQKEADLSFNKGAIIDLTHTVNEKWH